MKNSDNYNQAHAATIKLSKALTALGVLGLEHEGNNIYYRQNGYTIRIEVKAEKDRKLKRPPKGGVG